VNSDAPLLIVEDNHADVQLALEAFESQGFAPRVHVASDGVEAVDYLGRGKGFEQAARPGLVLLDLNLPRKSGLEVLAFIKGSDDLRRIPVVVFTSSTAKHDVAAAYSLNANSYVQKPVDFSSFERFARILAEYWYGIVRLPPD
jgi:CheY-like chemotaxis protein